MIDTNYLIGGKIQTKKHISNWYVWYLVGLITLHLYAIHRMSMVYEHWNLCLNTAAIGAIYYATSPFTRLSLVLYPICVFFPNVRTFTETILDDQKENIAYFVLWYHFSIFFFYYNNISSQLLCVWQVIEFFLLRVTLAIRDFLLIS